MKANYFISLLASIAISTTAFGKTIPNGAAADLVLGQSSFTTNAEPDPPSANSFNAPIGVIVDPVSRKVFVADAENSRVLRYASADSLANGAAAEAVFGQGSFNTKATGSGATGMNIPGGLCLDQSGRLWVADLRNNRVLMFNAGSSRSSGAAADRVYGQANFTNSASGAGQNQMNFPSDVFVDSSDRLWVADSLNNRVLRFDNITSKPNGANADGVLGQVNFTNTTAGTGAAGMNYPRGVTVSAGGELFVSCTSQSRVLRFNDAATLANGAAASSVLGQPDFNVTTPATSATKMDIPYGSTLTADDSLWVCDGFNKRMLRFNNASSKASGAAADGVVGQPDFVTSSSGLTDRKLASAFLKPFIDSKGGLWVPDSNNNRILRFPADSTAPLLALTNKAKKSTSKKKITIKGTASDQFGISLVQFKVNKGPLQTAVGTTTWQIKPALKKGNNKITVFATDSVGNVSLNKVIKIKRK
jgi:sugar lactone lactonase YvrE